MTPHVPPPTVDTNDATSAAYSPVTRNPWGMLGRFTDARIALGRAGVSLPTQPHLAFQLAHAQARDAVHLALDVQAFQDALQTLGQSLGLPGPALLLHSGAPDRHTYLQRPDLGRRLHPDSREALIARLTPEDAAALAAPTNDAQETAQARTFDVAFVVADGLSALAIGNHALDFLQTAVPPLCAEGWSVAPLCLVTQGRVAVADEIGQLLRARIVVIIIGERPGLSSPDSMGLYLTWMPRVGLTDASRNCISNVRPAGLPCHEAVQKLHYLLREARQRGISGVQLKDESATAAPVGTAVARGNFLLPAD